MPHCFQIPQLAILPRERDPDYMESFVSCCDRCGVVLGGERREPQGGTMERACQSCGRLFVFDNPAQRFCTRTCAKRSQRAAAKLSRLSGGGEAVPPPSPHPAPGTAHHACIRTDDAPDLTTAQMIQVASDTGQALRNGARFVAIRPIDGGYEVVARYLDGTSHAACACAATEPPVEDGESPFAGAGARGGR